MTNERFLWVLGKVVAVIFSILYSTPCYNGELPFANNGKLYYDNVETPVDNTYSEAEMEEIEAVTTEQIEEYARELGQKYYDYEIDTNVMKKIDGINLYYFAVHSGPPTNTVKEYMLGADGVLYNYQSAINGILQIEE